jgi:hypothetical protein
MIWILSINKGIFMSNHIMTVDFFGNGVRAETQGRMVSVNDLIRAGNQWRSQRGMTLKTVQQVMTSQGLVEYADAAAEVWELPKDELIKVIGKGSKARTMAHVSVAIYVAEQMSPIFHAGVIKTFIEGKLLEFRELGGTEFKNLNAAIDLHLPGREGKDNKGVYIQAAKLLRTKLLGADAEAGGWDAATVAQIHSRYEAEKTIIRFLEMGMVKDFEHLKEIIVKVGLR